MRAASLLQRAARKRCARSSRRRPVPPRRRASPRDPTRAARASAAASRAETATAAAHPPAYGSASRSGRPRSAAPRAAPRRRARARAGARTAPTGRGPLRRAGHGALERRVPAARRARHASAVPTLEGRRCFVHVATSRASREPRLGRPRCSSQRRGARAQANSIRVHRLHGNRAAARLQRQRGASCRADAAREQALRPRRGARRRPGVNSAQRASASPGRRAAKGAPPRRATERNRLVRQLAPTRRGAVRARPAAVGRRVAELAVSSPPRASFGRVAAEDAALSGRPSAGPRASARSTRRRVARAPKANVRDGARGRGGARPPPFARSSTTRSATVGVHAGGELPQGAIGPSGVGAAIEGGRRRRGRTRAVRDVRPRARRRGSLPPPRDGTRRRSSSADEHRPLDAAFVPYADEPRAELPGRPEKRRRLRRQRQRDRDSRAIVARGGGGHGAPRRRAPSASKSLDGRGVAAGRGRAARPWHERRPGGGARIGRRSHAPVAAARASKSRTAPTGHARRSALGATRGEVEAATFRRRAGGSCSTPARASTSSDSRISRRRLAFGTHLAASARAALRGARCAGGGCVGLCAAPRRSPTEERRAGRVARRARRDGARNLGGRVAVRLGGESSRSSGRPGRRVCGRRRVVHHRTDVQAAGRRRRRLRRRGKCGRRASAFVGRRAWRGG